MKRDVYENAGSATTTIRRPGGEERGGGQAEAEMEEMMRKGAPGPGHKALEHYVGNWRCEVKCWMDPKGEPEQSHATAKGSWIMGGRFLQEDFQGNFMGKPFNGRMILGFNNVKQNYQCTWFDDMNTSIFCSEGSGDSRELTLEGRSSCAATGRIDIPMKMVLRVIDENKHTFEMFDGSKGYGKTMEITYTRQ